MIGLTRSRASPSTRPEQADTKSPETSTLTPRIREQSKLLNSSWNQQFTLMLVRLINRFGTMAARGGVDMMLTRNDDGTLERMVEARNGQVGQACEREKQN